MKLYDKRSLLLRYHKPLMVVSLVLFYIFMFFTLATGDKSIVTQENLMSYIMVLTALTVFIPLYIFDNQSHQ